MPDEVRFLNMDSTKVEEITQINDNSVDLIITDPPYAQGSLHLFEGLARFALRKLKNGGTLVFYFGQHQLLEIIKLFSKYEEEEGEEGGGLTYAWQIAVIHTGNDIARFHDLGIRVEWKPMLWFIKGKKKDRLVNWKDIDDLIWSEPPDKDKHPWAQSPVEAEYIIDHLTVSEHALVVDPFLGSGAFGIAAAKLGRYFIGIDVDKEVFEDAMNNIKKEATKSR